MEILGGIGIQWLGSSFAASAALDLTQQEDRPWGSEQQQHMVSNILVGEGWTITN